MIKIEDLYLLEEAQEIKDAMILGIKGKLPIYVINHNNSSLQKLDPGELEQIRAAMPEAVKILSKSTRNHLSPLQKVSHKDLWVYKHELENILATRKIENKEIDLSKSAYWGKLEQLVKTAVVKYPGWKKAREVGHKIKKTTELKEWLQTLGADDREIHIMSKVLSDLNEELL
jgi:hypothetical protein